MKQIKLILTTILLLLLLSSISYGWSPPDINSPVLLDETDEDPWGELAYKSPASCCYAEAGHNLDISLLVGGIKLAISYFFIIETDVKTSGQAKFVSETIAQENGNNNNGTVEPCRTANTR